MRQGPRHCDPPGTGVPESQASQAPRVSRPSVGRWQGWGETGSQALGPPAGWLRVIWMALQLPEACLHLRLLQLTETSSRYARKISGTTALQEALKEKQQHIEQLLAERDLERAEVAKATSHICEVEKEIALLKAQHEQVGGRRAVGVPGGPGGLLGQPYVAHTQSRDLGVSEE